MMSIRNDHRGIMTPLPPSWVLPTAVQTTLIPDGEQTPEGVTGLLNTADLLDKIAQLQAQVRQPPGLSLQEVDESGSETGAEAFAFAPPAPHPVARPAKVGLQAAPMAELKAPVRSLGTMGHPFACASPCRYVKRKGGCRDGADCPNCHECFWTKAALASTWQRHYHSPRAHVAIRTGVQKRANMCVEKVAVEMAKTAQNATLVNGVEMVRRICGKMKRLKPSRPMSRLLGSNPLRRTWRKSTRSYSMSTCLCRRFRSWWPVWSRWRCFRPWVRWDIPSPVPPHAGTFSKATARMAPCVPSVIAATQCRCKARHLPAGNAFTCNIVIFSLAFACSHVGKYMIWT